MDCNGINRHGLKLVIVVIERTCDEIYHSISF